MQSAAPPYSLKDRQEKRLFSRKNIDHQGNLKCFRFTFTYDSFSAKISKNVFTFTLFKSQILAIIAKNFRKSIFIQFCHLLWHCISKTIFDFIYHILYR